MNFRLKLLPVFLSILFFFSSFFQICTTVYASDSTHGGGGSSSSNRPSGDEWFYGDGSLGSDKVPLVMSYLVSQSKCLYDGNFSSLISNYFDMKEYMTSDYISISDEPDENGDYNMIFSEDLTKAFKQALIEAAQEQNGFLIYPTTNYLSVPPSGFLNSYAYRTFCALVKENGCIVVNTNKIDSDTLYVARPFDDITKDSISLVVKSNYSNYLIVGAGFYGTNTWELYSTQSKIFRTVSYDTDYVAHYQEFHHWDEGTDYSEGIYSMPYTGLLDMRGKYPLGSVCGWTFFSDDGRRLRVFKSLNDLKNYTTGNRSVYFGSGFYDDIGEIKVSFDDLEKYINTDSDKLFDKLKDLIGENEGNLTEEDLEKIVDKLLGELDDIGGDIGGDIDKVDGSLKETNSILGGIASALSGYFESVLSYLDSILVSIQGLIFVEQIKPDDEHLDLSDMINDVWKDPQNGSQAVADSLSASFSDIASALMAKFPFCIPHDLYSLFNVFTNTPKGRASPASVDDSSIQLYSGADSVPCFELPLVIESLGIEEVIVIDMADFQPLSTVLRVFISLIFAVALMKFSATVIQLINNAWGGIS